MTYTDSLDLLIRDFKNIMMYEIRLSDLKLLHYFFGLQVMQIDNGTFLTQV